MMQIHEDVFPEPQAWWVFWLLDACSLGDRGVPSRQKAQDCEESWWDITAYEDFIGIAVDGIRHQSSQFSEVVAQMRVMFANGLPQDCSKSA